MEHNFNCTALDSSPRWTVAGDRLGHWSLFGREFGPKEGTVDRQDSPAIEHLPFDCSRILVGCDFHLGVCDRPSLVTSSFGLYYYSNGREHSHTPGTSPFSSCHHHTTFARYRHTQRCAGSASERFCDRDEGTGPGRLAVSQTCNEKCNAPIAHCFLPDPGKRDR